MEERNDAPAFPVIAGNQVYATGLTLRDWFAGQAAAAIIGGLVSSKIDTEEGDAIFIAKASYDLAEAMMEARK